MHSSAWKGYSANFARTEFLEVPSLWLHLSGQYSRAVASPIMPRPWDVLN
jgi:hypothetical protein